MSRRPTPPADDVPIARCCENHPDWPTLAEHVAADFPQVAITDVARELRVAKDVVDRFAVGPDALEIGELIARHRLMLVSGDAVDSAKLDPQRHERRTRSTT